MATDAPARPNIVYILADDLGYGDLSCLNSEARTRTPAHDSLASQGMVFTDAHSNSAVCTPTRYGVLTGRYAWRGHLKEGVLFGYSGPLLEPGRLTVAQLLAGQGYTTACVGKWHLGLGWRMRDGSPAVWSYRGVPDPGVDFSMPLTAGPHTVGFEYSYIIPASLDMAPYCYIENGRVTELPGMTSPGRPTPTFWRGGPTAPSFDHQGCLLHLTQRATRFIAEQKSDRPFFLYFPTNSPHTPHLPRAPFLDSSRAGAYGDFVHEHDWSVGQIVKAIDDAGLADNTLIIVTSDNGAHMRGNSFDFEAQYGHRSNFIYRGQKSDCWDGGHRVPMIARWPGVICPGSRCDKTVCLTDLMATVAEITGVRVPAGAGEDSQSLLPHLRGQDAPGRATTIHHSINGFFAIRRGRWKLIDCRGSGGWSLNEKNVPASSPSVQLYDVQEDPAETTNLAGDRPGVVAELLDVLRSEQAVVDQPGA